MTQQTNNNTMYIQQFAKLVGVHVDTVKNWQAKGILPDNRDQLNNWRIFTQDDVQKIQKMRQKTATSG